MSRNENWANKYDLNSIAELPTHEFYVSVSRLVAELRARHESFKVFDRRDESPELLILENSHKRQVAGLASDVFSSALDSLVDGSRMGFDCGFAEDKDFLKLFNGLYGGKGGRRCNEILSLVWGCEFDEECHIGHILPRSRPELFGALFPSLDVDNILNLAPQGYLSNCICGNAALPFVFTVHRCYLEVYKKILNVRHRLEALLQSEDTLNAHSSSEVDHESSAAHLIDVDLNPQFKDYRVFQEKVTSSINDPRSSIPHEAARQVFADKKARIRDEIGLK